jgi:hypothetical protein
MFNIVGACHLATSGSDVTALSAVTWVSLHVLRTCAPPKDAAPIAGASFMLILDSSCKGNFT